MTRIIMLPMITICAFSLLFMLGLLQKWPSVLKWSPEREGIRVNAGIPSGEPSTCMPDITSLNLVKIKQDAQI